MGNPVVALAEPGRFSGRPDHVFPVTKIRPSAETPVAKAAEDRKAGDHPVAGLHVTHLAAHGFHCAGGFMAEHDRHVDPVFALDKMQVAVTDSGGAGAD